MHVNIRSATRADCSRMMELVQELAEFERAPEAVTATVSHFEESGFGERPVWWAFVAETDNMVEGFALYYVRYSTWKGQRMYLEDLYVTRNLRNQGIGGLLFDRLLEEAKARHFSGIVWQVLEWNAEAIQFYKKYPTDFDPEWVNCSINW